LHFFHAAAAETRGKIKRKGRDQFKNALAVVPVGSDIPGAGADADESGAGGAVCTWNRRGELLDAEGVGVARGTAVDTG